MQGKIVVNILRTYKQVYLTISLHESVLISKNILHVNIMSHRTAGRMGKDVKSIP